MCARMKIIHVLCFRETCILNRHHWNFSLICIYTYHIIKLVYRFLPPANCWIIPRLMKCQKQVFMHWRLAEYILPDSKYNSIHCHIHPLFTSTVLWIILRLLHYIPPFSYNFNQQLRTWQHLYAQFCMALVISYACMNWLFWKLIYASCQKPQFSPHYHQRGWTAFRLPPLT